MKRINVLLFSSLVLIFTLHPCTLLIAQEAADVTSPSGVFEINKVFLDPMMNVESFVERFEVESREVYHARDDIMRHLNLKPGERIADVGAGTGYYSLLMADAVGDTGWVYAVEISPRFVEHLAKLFDQHKKTNVTTVMCNDNSVCLPPGSVDAAFICDVYHHFEHPEQTMTSIFEAMAPGGHLIVIDFERIVGVAREWTLCHVRAGKQTFIDEIQSVGFELAVERKVPGFKETYYLEFLKP